MSSRLRAELVRLRRALDGDGGAGRRELLATVLVSLAVALPLLLSPLVPGGDTPWHAAVIAILGDHDPARYLGYFDSDAGFGSYVVVYRLLAAVARATSAVMAVKLLAIAYAVGTVWASRRLVRALGGDGWVALLVAPAVYSTSLEFGFLIYLPAIPLTLLLWALCREHMTGAASRVRLAALALTWLAVCFTHPFAAALAGGGVAVLVLADLRRGRRERAASIALALALGAVPAVLAVLAASGAGEPHLPGLAHASLVDRLTTQVFVPVADSLTTAPAYLVGFVAHPLRVAIVAVLAAAALVHRLLAAAAPSTAAPSPPSRRAAWLLVIALALVYLVTPFTFEWPRNWYGAQPRVLPLLWVALLAALAAAPGPSRWPRSLHAGLACASIALIWFQALGPIAREGRDLEQVIARAAPSARVLALVEQPPARWSWPPSPWRSAGAWLVAERGGYASYLPMAVPGGRHVGHHIPVHLAADAPAQPSGPGQGRARWFVWSQHGAGWDEFLVRDLDPAAPHDYFAAAPAGAVELVARAGRWRLYRRVR